MKDTSTAGPTSQEWWPRPQGRRAPRTSVDRELAVHTAMKLIERDGLEAFSMRRLAAELGVGAPALYWHVESREQLLCMVLEHSLQGFEFPEQDLPWQELLVETAHRWWRHWSAQPEVGGLLDQDLPPFPTMMRVGEYVAGLLLDAGLSRRDTALSLAAWQVYLTGAGRGVRRLSNKGLKDATESAYVGAMLYLKTSEFPHLRSLAVEYANTRSPEALYDGGLRSLVAGFEALAGQQARVTKRGRTKRTAG